MSKEKVTFKESNEQLKKKSKKLVSILLILGTVGFGGGYFYGINHLTDDHIKEPTAKELLKRADEKKNKSEEFISEIDIVNASSKLSSDIKENYGDVDQRQALYFISLLNIEEINKTNPELANKIKESISYDEYMEINDYVISEIHRTSTNYGITIDLTPYIFNNKDKEIISSVQLITEFVNSNVYQKNTEELNNVVIEDFIKPVYNLNDGYLNTQGKRIKDKPTTGLMYTLYKLNSFIILTNSNEMLDDAPNKILNEMLKDTKVNDAVKDIYTSNYQKTK